MPIGSESVSMLVHLPNEKSDGHTWRNGVAKIESTTTAGPENTIIAARKTSSQKLVDGD